MTDAEYKRLTIAQMLVRRWRLTRDCETRGGDLVAKGSEVEIIRKFGGLWVRPVPCAHCGASVGIKGLSPSDVEEVTG